MTQRLNFFAVAPGAIQPLVDSEAAIKASGLELSLIELVKIRASQINGCANCLHMHTADARAAGEREERIFLLDAWRESAMYTPRERAALAWTEVLTRLSVAHPTDADYDALKPHFSEVEIVNLTVLITLINAWNRIAVGFGAQHKNDRALAAAA